MKIYVIVPKNVDSDKPPYKIAMTCGKMAAQVGHAIHLLTVQMIQDGNGALLEDDFIVLQVKDTAEMHEEREKLIHANIFHIEYRDISNVFEGEVLTALALRLPQWKAEESLLSHLKTWRCACNELQRPSSSGRAPDNNQGVAGSVPASGSNS